MSGTATPLSAEVRKLRLWLGLGQVAFMLAALLGPAVAQPAPCTLLKRAQVAFEPARGQMLQLPLSVKAKAAVRLEILTADGEVVRTLNAGSLPVGRHELRWDGRDRSGELVPDEAYQPVLRCQVAGQPLFTADPRSTSGGVVLDKLHVRLSPAGRIDFALPEPARVLVRVGIRGGAMMRGLGSWAPHAAGSAHVDWDGKDESGVISLLGKSGLTALVTAFSLPDHAIVTHGNATTSYKAYRAQQGFPPPLVDTGSIVLERDGKRLSRQAGFPRSALWDPQVSLRVVGGEERDSDGAIKVRDPLTFRVDIAAEDKWLLEQSLYEVGFFLDGQFVSEEETGYSPLRWRWLPGQLARGVHTMTVNVSGLWGQVGVASVRLVVE